jgi:hypothetical protein
MKFRDYVFEAIAAWEVTYDGPHMKKQKTTVRTHTAETVDDVLLFMKKTHKDVRVLKIERDGKVLYSKGKESYIASKKKKEPEKQERQTWSNWPKSWPWR